MKRCIGACRLDNVFASANVMTRSILSNIRLQLCKLYVGNMVEMSFRFGAWIK